MNLFRSRLKREIEEAVNTPWDRLEDRTAKTKLQIQTRRQRMKDLNCAQVLKDGSGGGESRNPACWTGTFTGPDSNGHAMTINLTQGADGKVRGGWKFNQSGTKSQRDYY